MIKVENSQQLINVVNSIRGLKKGYITNFYFDVAKTELLVSHGLLYVDNYDEVTFILKKNNDCFNVYYCATKVDMLEAALRRFNEKYCGICLLFDIVGSSKQCTLIRSAFDSNGFFEYVSLVRMARITPNEDLNYCRDSCVGFATEQDAVIVHQLLLAHFDYRAEQLPMLDEIVTFAMKSQLLVYKQGAEVLGFVVFENTMSTLYLRYWFALPLYRDKKIGSALLREFFNQGVTTKRQLFWVIQSNDNAIKRYRHYGFEPEDMFDYVLVNKEIKYAETNN